MDTGEDAFDTCLSTVQCQGITTPALILAPSAHTISSYVKVPSPNVLYLYQLSGTTVATVNDLERFRTIFYPSTDLAAWAARGQRSTRDSRLPPGTSTAACRGGRCLKKGFARTGTESYQRRIFSGEWNISVFLEVSPTLRVATAYTWINPRVNTLRVRVLRW